MLAVSLLTTAELSAISEALTQFVENDDDMADIRSEEGGVPPVKVTLCRAMLDAANAEICFRLGA